jgi:hypothetical protein
MPRRFVLMVISILVLAVVGVRANDFWNGKDWKQWSKDECASMLNESPWAHTWRIGDGSDEMAYLIQIRSALPIREAIVRQLQIDQKYDKLNETQRVSFDSQASQILSRNYEDSILVHVDFSKADAADIHAYVQKTSVSLEPFLASDDGSQIKPDHVDWSQRTDAFDLVFPRAANGSQVIKEGQKHLTVQFQIPPLGGVGGKPVPGRRIRVEFEIAKMVFNGKLSY